MTVQDVIFTAQEQEFLQKVLELLGIKYDSWNTGGVISSITYKFDCSKDEMDAITGMMNVNYNKTILGRR